MTDLQEPATSAPAQVQQYQADWWNPTSLEQATEMAGKFAKSELVPKDFRGKPDAIVVAWSLGAPLGLSMLSSLQYIAVVNGRPSLWGDAALAICRNHPACKFVIENLEGEGDDMVAVCQVGRVGDPEPVVRRFSVADAKKAGLWGKNVWSQYPKRMLQMRARSWALRDAFPDALCGMPIAEEVRDITPDVQVRDAGPEPQGETATERLLSKVKPSTSTEGVKPDTSDAADDGARETLEFEFECLCRDRAEGDAEKAAKIEAELLASLGKDEIGDVPTDELRKVIDAMKAKLKK